jgi:hypothetical protein
MKKLRKQGPVGAGLRFRVCRSMGRDRTEVGYGKRGGKKRIPITFSRKRENEVFFFREGLWARRY